MSESLPEINDQNTTETPPESPQQKRKWRQFLIDALETIGLAVILYLAINFVSARVRVEGISMQPTLKNGEYMLVNRLAYRFGEPQRGDIIIFRPPMYPESDFFERVLGMPNIHNIYKDYVKRIIGLPGDTIKVESGILYVNGTPLSEVYIAAAPAYTGEWQVNDGYLFVLGDNRNNSSDSHTWGFLPLENVVGKAILVYWPFSEWTVLSHTPVYAATP